MAIAFDTPGNVATSGTSSASFSYTVGSGSNRALWVIATCWNTSDYLATATVSYGGTSLGSPLFSVLTGNGNNTYVWQMAAPPSGAATVLVTPSSSAYLDVWAVSASGVDQALLAALANNVSNATSFGSTPYSQSVTTPAGGACISFGSVRVTSAVTMTPVSGNGFTAAGTPPSGSYAHTALATAQAPTAHGWSWTGGSPGNDLLLVFALPINAASAPDTTAPTLSSPTGSATGTTTATVGATTDEGNGTLYAVVTTSATAPTKAQVKAGQNAAGSAANWSGSVAVSSTGAKTLNATGLTASTAYYAHLMHEDAATNQSNVVSSTSFTTSAGASGSKGRFYYQFGSPQC